MGGSSRCAGRVEVKVQGASGILCANSWGINIAEVVCRQLECGSPILVYREPHFTERTLHIFISNSGCTGREASLWDCIRWEWKQTACRLNMEASVICSGNFWTKINTLIQLFIFCTYLIHVYEVAT